MPNIDKKLYSDIKSYCKINNIDDVDVFCNKLLEKAFVLEKYGATPQILPTKTVEKNIEVPVVYEPEKVLPLQNEEPVQEVKDVVVKEEPPKEELPKEEPKPEPRKIFKKANLNDDYKIYDI